MIGKEGKSFLLGTMRCMLLEWDPGGRNRRKIQALSLVDRKSQWSCNTSNRHEGAAPACDATDLPSRERVDE
jgi:hypothetical protein